MSIQQAAGDGTGQHGRSVSVKEAAVFLSVSEDAVRRMMRTGRLAYFPTGERYGYRIPSGEIERLLAAQDAGRTVDNGWLAQGRALRLDAVRQHLEAMSGAAQTLLRESRAALEKLDALEREGEERR